MLRVGDLRDRLPWVAVLLTLATAVAWLLGPGWSTAEGENPLERPTGIDLPAVLRLALPTVMSLGAVVVALGDRRRWWLGVLGLVAFGVALLVAPAPLPLWFAPAGVLTAVAFVLSLGRTKGSTRRTRPGASR